MLELTLPVTRRRVGLLNEAQVIATLTRYELERVRAPTLTLSAADDAFGTYDAARYTAEQIPGGRFVGVSDGGHLLVGHREAATGEITAWLSRYATRSNASR